MKQENKELLITAIVSISILVLLVFAINWECNREYNAFKDKYQFMCESKGFDFISYDIPGTGHYADCVSDDGYSWYYDRYNMMLQRRPN